MRVAAIDVGTNTTRLLAAEATSSGYRDLERRLTFTRLGEGVDAGGNLSPAAMKRTLEAIAEFCALAGELGVDSIRVAGTSALRDAANKNEFTGATAKLLGVEPDVLSGEDEAKLSFIGATAELHRGSYLVCDIGGGSTELVFAAKDDRRPVAVSLNLGAVRLTERFLHSDPPAAEEMLTMEAAIDDALSGVAGKFDIQEETRLVGLAGTVTSLAAISLGLDQYDPALTHHLVMPRPLVRDLYLRLAGMSVEERSKFPCLPPGRADIIVAGASILTRVMTQWPFGRVIVSEKDILDGLVMQMLGDELDQ